MRFQFASAQIVIINGASLPRHLCFGVVPAATTSAVPRRGPLANLIPRLTLSPRDDSTSKKSLWAGALVPT
jgi:hypothetical protein